MQKSSVLALMAFAVASFGTRTASAERVRLVYHGPAPTAAGCPREDEAFITLRAGLPKVAGDPANEAETAEAQVEVVSDNGRYVGTLTLHAHEQSLSRKLESPSCSDLLRAMSFVLGVAYRETTEASATSATSATPAPIPAAIPAPRSAPAPHADAAVERDAAKSSSSSPRIELGLAARASALWGVMPTTAPRFEGYLELGVKRDSFLSPSFRAGAAYANAGIDVDGGRADFSVLTAAGSACPIRIGGGSGKMELVPCARVEIGDLYGEGAGIPSARDRHSLWAAAGPELTGRWMLSATVGLELSTALLAPLRRQAFVIDPGRVIHQTGAIAFHAGAGLFFSAL